MNEKLKKEEIVQKILQSNIDFDGEEEEIIHAILQETISKDVNNIHKNAMSFGDKMSDSFAKFAGSWTFIISFTIVLISWIVINVMFLKHPFDPFPFILLNLVLSCIAAIQAPIIMMSQNRQEEKDRLRSQNDYKVNLKSELIIEDLHKKIDQLIENQEKILKALYPAENKDN